MVFLIQGGSLNLSGKGVIRETKPNYGAITLKGSNDPNKKDFSTVSIGSGVTLEGWSGIFINHYNKTGYGILVNMNGKIKATNDLNGNTGIGIYVNGFVQNQINSPTINLSSTTNIISTGSGIYAAGYATYNINGAYIEGKESGLGIKSGVFNILDATIIGTGEDKTPTNSNNNGINASGTSIQIESNPGYTGNIELNIKNGTFKSNKSYVVYEYTLNNNPTQIKNIAISGGTFISTAGKNVFLLSDSLKENHKGFISGGTYSSNPTNLLKNGYIASLNDNSLYEVVHNSTGVFKVKTNNNSNPFIIITIIILIIISIIFSYINRKKIFNFFSPKKQNNSN